LDTTLFHGATLASIKSDIAHVFCATDLQMGQNVFFANSFVYSWRSGWGSPGTIRTAQVVQASAALPGAFSVVSFPLHRFGLPEDRVVADKRHPPTKFKLLDGGVYDNMGSEWLLNIRQHMTDGTPPVTITPVDEAIVVNASAGDSFVERRWIKAPFIGEILSLLAVKDVMYRQTTAVRRRLLNVRYRIAQDRPSIPPNARILRDALRGSMIQIDRSPFALADEFRGFRDEMGDRAVVVVEALERDSAAVDARSYWTAEADANHTVKTTLSRVDPGRAASIIRHGYTLTMANCHVLLDYPLLAIPEPDRFASLTAK
jgi:hypothetical protein